MRFLEISKVTLLMDLHVINIQQQKWSCHTPTVHSHPNVRHVGTLSFIWTLVDPWSLFYHRQVGEKLLRDFIFIHLDSNEEKFNLLCFMLRKLYALTDGKCAEDNPDAVTNQEVLTAGHLFTMFIQEKISEAFQVVRQIMRKDERTSFKG